MNGDTEVRNISPACSQRRMLPDVVSSQWTVMSDKYRDVNYPKVFLLSIHNSIHILANSLLTGFYFDDIMCSMVKVFFYKSWRAVYIKGAPSRSSEGASTEDESERYKRLVSIISWVTTHSMIGAQVSQSSLRFRQICIDPEVIEIWSN